MNVIDKLYTEWAWRTKSGTPSIKNAEDKAILDKLINELSDSSEGVKPINYNPFISVLRAYQQTLLDYYVSPAADKAQDITAAVIEKYKNIGKNMNLKLLLVF